MALWQGTLSCWNINWCFWSLNICSIYYWLQKIITHEVNVRILVDISINHYQIANARKLMHPQTITETFLRRRNRIASGFIFYLLVLQHSSLLSLVRKINLHSSKSSTKAHLPLVVHCLIILAHLMFFCRFFLWTLRVFFLPLGWISPRHVCSRHRTVAYDKCLPKNVLQSKDKFEVVFKHTNIYLIACRRLFSLLSDTLYIAQILFIAAELRCKYMIFKRITHEPYSLNLDPKTNVSSGSNNCNAQT